MEILFVFIEITAGFATGWLLRRHCWWIAASLVVAVVGLRLFYQTYWLPPVVEWTLGGITLFGLMLGYYLRWPGSQEDDDIIPPDNLFIVTGVTMTNGKSVPFV